ncbi:MAG: hypothetical protein ACRCY3_03650 [Sphingorhabdus sp.]
MSVGAPPLRFHACPPEGVWFNDPNGLVKTDRGWTLFTQVRTDAPDYRRVGWARLTSSDLIDWKYEGVVIPSDSASDAWSGSVLAEEDGLHAFYTRHRDGLQEQVRSFSVDGGASWASPILAIGPARVDWRDPFLFQPEKGGAWFALVAAPCPWNPPPQARSTIEIYRSDDGRNSWRYAGMIGPWSEPGILWEVPIMVREPGSVDRWSLIVSTVDRRGDRADCTVLRWRGRWLEDGFLCDGDPVSLVQPLDYGPDFYAVIAGGIGDDASNDIPLIGWASSWQTARDFPWPGFAGGPLSIVRRLTANGSDYRPEFAEAFTIESPKVPLSGFGITDFLTGALELRIETNCSTMSIVIAADGAIRARREGPDWLKWHTNALPTVQHSRRLSLFVDGPLFELHIAPDDRFLTFALPGNSNAAAISLKNAGLESAIHWRMLPPA